jgi:hypothetical protein
MHRKAQIFISPHIKGSKEFVTCVKTNTYVSEKDFFVFLCRLETAILAANCKAKKMHKN